MIYILKFGFRDTVHFDFLAVEFFLSGKFDEGQTNFPESTHDAITYAAMYSPPMRHSKISKTWKTDVHADASKIP